MTGTLQSPEFPASISASYVPSNKSGTQPAPPILQYGNYVFVPYSNSGQTNYGVSVIDVSNPAAPVLHEGVWVDTANYAPADWAVQGHYLYYINTAGTSIITLDISNPLAPTQTNILGVVGTFNNPGLTAVWQLEPGTNCLWAYGRNYQGVYCIAVVDLTTPQTPIWKGGGAATALSRNQAVFGMVSDGTEVYVLQGTSSSGGSYAYINTYSNAPGKYGTECAIGGDSTSPLAHDMAYDATRKRLFLPMYYGSGYIPYDAIVDVSNPSLPTATTSFSSRYDSNTSSYINTIGLTWANGVLYEITNNSALWIYDTSGTGVPAVISTTAHSAFGANENNYASMLVSSDGNYLYVLYSGYFTVVEAVKNLAPNAITFNSPDPTAGTLDNTVAQQFSWTFSDPNTSTGDYQSKADIQYWQLDSNGARVGSATTILGAATTAQNYTFAANTFGTAQYEFQIRTYDSSGTVGPWGPSAFYTFATPPAAPSVTAPANNSTVAGTATVSWTSANQDFWSITISDPNLSDDPNAYYVDSHNFGNSATDHSKEVFFFQNNVTRQIAVVVHYQGLYSQPGIVDVNVSYTTPVASTVTSALVDDAGFGFPYALAITDVQSTQPVGDSYPTVTTIDISVREAGDPVATELRLAAGVQPNSTVKWYAPRSGVDYEAKVRTYGDNNTYVDSDWTPVVGRIDLHGVVIHAANDPAGTIKFLKYNDAGATDTLSTETVVTQYQGRPYPVVEYGDANTYEVSVPTIQAINGGTDAFDLRALIALKTTLCYRDRKGRKVFGAASASQIADMRGGETTSLDITAVDYTEGV